MATPYGNLVVFAPTHHSAMPYTNFNPVGIFPADKTRSTSFSEAAGRHPFVSLATDI